MLAAATAACTVAILITFIRWWYLVRAGHPVPLRRRHPHQLLGLSVQFRAAGHRQRRPAEGRDADHEYPQHRAKAVASVLVDRVIGLYVLFVFVTVAILSTGFYWHNFHDAFLRRTCEIMFWVTAGSTVGLALVLGPERTSAGSSAWSAHPPRRPALGKPGPAVRMFRHEPAVLGLTSFATIFVHGLFAVGVSSSPVAFPAATSRWPITWWPCRPVRPPR